MKRFRVLIFIGLVIAISGCTGLSVVIPEGVYNLTPRFGWGNIEWTSNTIEESFFSDWRSQSDLEFLIQKPETWIMYGTLTMGNNGQVFRFGVTANGNYVDRIYMDQDNNGKIDGSEEIFATKSYSYTTSFWDTTVETCFSNANTSLDVPYIKADGSKVYKKIYVTLGFSYSSGGISMSYRVLSFFQGEVITENPELKKVKFILVDMNNNAVFNDYGKDLFVVDKNGDGRFGFGTEKKRLTEFIQIPAQKSQPKQTLRLSLFAYPEKIIVTDADAAPPEPGLLEPAAGD